MNAVAAAPTGPQSLKGWERWVGHIGYVSGGIIYMLIGVYALIAGIERKHQPNGPEGAFARLGKMPFGKALLALLALGLAAFVVWQLILAIVDPEHRPERNQLRRVMVRLGHFFTAVLYCGILGQAVWRLLGLGRAGGEETKPAHLTMWAMRLPFGRYAVAAVGLGIGVFALRQCYRAATRSKSKRVDLSRTRFRHLINAAGIYGFVSRGVLFGLVGIYLVDAAWRFDPKYSGGIAGALSALQSRPFGIWFLGTVAVGLISYGVFQISKERYRRFLDS